MAGPANLRVNIFADTKKLKKGLDDAKNKTKNFSLKSVASFAAIGTAATLAFDFVKDSIAGAIEEQDQIDKLNGALGRLKGGFLLNKDAVNQWITQLGYATDQTDDSLRPALGRLLDTTGDLKTAQDLLVISTDLATASGKPFETVVAAVAKAQEGNKTALVKLFPELVKVNDKTKTGADLIRILGEKYDGASTAATKTSKGGLATLQEAFGNIQETLGTAILPYLDTFAQYMASPEGQAAIAEFSTKLETFATSAGNAADDVDDLYRSLKAVYDFNEKYNFFAKLPNLYNLINFFQNGGGGTITDSLGGLGNAYGGISPSSMRGPSNVINISTIDPAAAGVAVRRAINTDQTRRGRLTIGGN